MLINCERDHDISERFRHGQTQAEIARALGYSREWIRQLLKRKGITGCPPPVLPERDQFVAVLAQAESLSDATQKLSLSSERLRITAKELAATDELVAARKRWRIQRTQARHFARQGPLIRQIQELAIRLGHTPTECELRAIEISHTTLIVVFGSNAAAMQACGLAPNWRAHTSPLPPDFAR